MDSTPGRVTLTVKQVIIDKILAFSLFTSLTQFLIHLILVASLWELLRRQGMQSKNTCTEFAGTLRAKC